MMRLFRVIACAVALAYAGAGAVAVAAADPFDDAVVAVRWKENAKALALLESGGFDVNRQNSEGYTLLHIAADQNNLEMARELLKRGADPNIRSKIGSSVADMAYSGSPLLAEVLKAGGKYAKNAPHTPAPAAPMSKAPALQAKPGGSVPAAAKGAEDPRRKMCNARHYSSAALCSDSSCKMREYRKWQTCLKTGSYH
jgi:ankyrin repeat protein